MQCEQIQGYLGDYVKRDLPTHKLGWVAQHLAGCERCRELLRELTPAPVATTVEVADQWKAEQVSYGLQRRVPGWVRAAGLAMAVALAAAGVSALKLAESRATEPQPGIAETAKPVSFQASVQRQFGVTLTLASVARHGREVVATVRFSDEGLTPSGAESWLRVFDEERLEVPATITSIKTAIDGIDATVRFSLPAGQTGFLLRFGEVHQISTQRWLLRLPDPRQPLNGEESLLEGSPSGVTLQDYAIKGALLNVHLRLPGRNRVASSPSFQLRDGEGAIYSVVKSSETQGYGNHHVELQFPLPRELRLPFTLVGSVPVRKEVGPWLLDGNVVK